MLDGAAADAVALSLRVSIMALAGSLVPGVAVAYLLARTRFPGRTLLLSIVYLPLVLPPVVTGYALLILLGPHGALGAPLQRYLHLTLAFRWTGAAVASAVMGFPLLVRAVQLSFEAVDRGLEDAAATLGAGPWRIFLVVTLPLALPGIFAGAMLAFAKSLGEFGATITFVSNIPGETQTLPLAIYSLLQVPGTDSEVLWLVALSVAISLLAVGGAETLAARLARQR